MATEPSSTEPKGTMGQDFARQAEENSPGLVREFLMFLTENKKWWLIPILVAVGLIGLLVALSSTAIAPLIYPLF